MPNYRNKRQREEDYYSSKLAYWEKFQSEVEKIESFIDAQILVEKAPNQGHPGRSYHSNLGFFLHTFRPPDGANSDELKLYLKLLKRLNSKGEVKQDKYEELENNICEAIDSKEQIGQ